MNGAKFKAPQGYRGRTYQLEYQGLPTSFPAGMTVDVVCTWPDTEEFTIVSEGGPKYDGQSSF